MRAVKEVFEITGKSFLVTNVADAVRGLPGESNISDIVGYYGDRNLAMSGEGIFYKAPRNEREAKIISTQIDFLNDMGLGPKRHFSVPALNGYSGIVDLLKGNIRIPLRITDGHEIQFFVVTKEAEYLAESLRAKVIGSDSDIAKKMNDKVYQRETMFRRSGINFFPECFIATTKKNAFKAYELLRKNGEVCLKIGFLASGIGMEPVKDAKQVADFWDVWTPIAEKLGYEKKIILERWHENVSSYSMQYFVHKGKIYELGASAQHIGVDGKSHEGNMIGADIGTLIPFSVIKKMQVMSRLALKIYKGIEGFVCFDFVADKKGLVCMTEVNLRQTATTILYSIQSQLPGGENMTLDLRKVEVKNPHWYDTLSFLKEVRNFNESRKMIIPLTPRLLESTGKMFVAVVASTVSEVNEAWKELHSWF
jgi:hypothetical protein